MALAHELAERPPEGVRVILLSTGSEESFMEGMQGFGRRHFARARPRDAPSSSASSASARRSCAWWRARGCCGCATTPSRSREALARAGAAAGVELQRGLRTVAATDALIALRAGYPTCTLGGVDETKFPSNYHWPSDIPDNLDWSSVEGAVAVCLQYVRA